MKKLELRMEDLRVDTFQTVPTDKEKGTVFGQAWSQPLQASCNGDDTCAGTCGPACVSLNTCDYFTCPGYVSRWDGNQFCVYC
ncbi:hypothetical protein SAMN05216486_10745 [bacterium JGI 053]|nr:hypothetical protein SAMN05216486_10745 [bacterium JGI 053]